MALVCSGDAGIYAMAALVYELLDRPEAEGGVSRAARAVEVGVLPGVSALQAAAARIGAPLGHDFCAISLSDLLTPRDDILRRIRAAADGDFVIAFYNPVSRRRRTLLAEARDILLAQRPGAQAVLATNLGRPGRRCGSSAAELRGGRGGHADRGAGRLVRQPDRADAGRAAAVHPARLCGETCRGARHDRAFHRRRSGRSGTADPPGRAADPRLSGLPLRRFAGARPRWWPSPRRARWCGTQRR